MPRIKVTTTQNVQIEFELAKLVERILARLIDNMVIMAPGAFIFWFIQKNSRLLPRDGDAGYWLLLTVVFLYFLIYIGYYLFFEIMGDGQSVGKRLMKIRVVRLDGSQPQITDYLLRWIFRLIDFPMSGGIIALLTASLSPHGQRLGDMVAGTTVISLKTKLQNYRELLEKPDFSEDYEVLYPQVGKLIDADLIWIKNLYRKSRASNNPELIQVLAKKVRELLNISSDEPPVVFLRRIIKDYEFMNNRW